MINKRTYYFLFSLSFTCVIFNSCHKEEKLFARHIFGHVSDYFDGNDVEGVKVSLVYTYGFIEFDSNSVFMSPCIAPDTIETKFTDKYGEFSFNYHPLEVLDVCDRGNGDNYKYNYYLIFEKKGTDYFKQFEIINNTKNLRDKIEYKLRPIITFEFKFSTTIHMSDSVRCYAKIIDLFYQNPNHYVYKSGVNIDTTIVLTTEFIDQINYNYDVTYPPPWYSSIYIDEQGTLTPTKKKYQFDIIY